MKVCRPYPHLVGRDNSYCSIMKIDSGTSVQSEVAVKSGRVATGVTIAAREENSLLKSASDCAAYQASLQYGSKHRGLILKNSMRVRHGSTGHTTTKGEAR